ncbi:MAG: tetratricopeptide repeat protein [Dokdonella sp.]
MRTVVFVLVAALMTAAPTLHAQVSIKPIPTPDTSKLPHAQAAQLLDDRNSFEKAKVKLVGEPLAQAYALIGSAYAQAGLYDAATVALDDAAALAPRDARWIYAQGLLARAQKRAAVAQNYFERAFDVDQDYLPIRTAVARSKFDNGDLDGARKLMTDYVAKHSDQAMPYALLGEIALRQKRYPDAIEQTRHALALDPNASALYATLSAAQAAAGDAKGAAESRAKQGLVQPAMSDPLGEGLFGASATGASSSAPPEEATLAAQALAERNYAVARQHLDTALKVHPNDATLLALYARVEAGAGNLDAAKSRAAAAVAADPSNALTHLSQGIALEMSGDDSGARHAYEQAVHANAQLSEPRMLLGSLLQRTGHPDEAVVQYRALVQSDLGDSEAWMRLVGTYTAAGHCAAALRDVSDVLAKDATNKFLLQLFVRLASTCPVATAAEKRGALDYGAKLYGETQAAQSGEAYALALAANGKWDDAVKIQQAAMFVLVRDGLKAQLPSYRETLQQLQAHKLPDRPWRASAAVYHPTRLVPDPQLPVSPSKK